MIPAHAESKALAAASSQRHAAQGTEPSVLTDIYRPDVNMAVWQRALAPELQDEVETLTRANPALRISVTLTPDSALAKLQEALGIHADSALSHDIALLVDMFCCLFELKQVGLRLTVLNRAMCPRFHVDRVPCRLVTTYQGSATEWLPHSVVNRAHLGPRSGQQSDLDCGLYQRPHDVQQLSCGDVALLKGELWAGNENAGLVHRSPTLTSNERRLLLTLDFSD